MCAILHNFKSNQKFFAHFLIYQNKDQTHSLAHPCPEELNETSQILLISVVIFSVLFVLKSFVILLVFSVGNSLSKNFHSIFSFSRHTFCRKCLSHWLKDHHTCPFCRDDVDQQLMSKDQIASSLIQDLEVHCVNSQCPWTDRLEELDNHFKNCNFSQPPEWLTRAKDIIEIDDEQISQKSPEKTEIPPLIVYDI